MALLVLLVIYGNTIFIFHSITLTPKSSFLFLCVLLSADLATCKLLSFIAIQIKAVRCAQNCSARKHSAACSREVDFKTRCCAVRYGAVETCLACCEGWVVSLFGEAAIHAQTLHIALIHSSTVDGRPMLAFYPLPLKIL